MAHKRAFSKDVVDSDPFVEMPLSAQALYFQLGMNVDDDGFVFPNKVIREVQADSSDLSVLIENGFVIPFESGVVVVRHHWVNNNKRMQRYHQTIHQAEKAMLIVQDGMPYELVKESGDQWSTSGQPVVNQWLTQSKVKESKVKESKVSSIVAVTDRPTTTDEPRVKDFITLWNDNRATINISQNRDNDQLSKLLSIYGYGEVMRTVYELSQKAYFVEKHKAEIRWFLNESNYQKIIDGKYDNSSLTVAEDFKYSEKYSDWIQTKCRLTYADYVEQKKTEQEEREKAKREEQEEREREAEKQRLEAQRIAEERAEQKRKEEAELQKEFEQWKKETGRHDAHISDFILGRRNICTRG